MLNNLTIENYALIGKLKVDFERGLNLLTGETGAGKSIIIGALSMVLGEKQKADVVRSGEEKAFVEANFAVEKNKKIKKVLDGAGIEADSNLILSREILSGGRTQARVNGRAVTQNVLRSVSRSLIDIHGQHEHQSLLDAENHIDLLDNLGGKDILKLREKVSSEYSKLTGLKEELGKLEAGQAEREKQIDYIKFQIKEIDDAGLKEGEDEDLGKEKDLLANAEKLASGASEIQGLISGSEDSGTADKIRVASERLKELATYDRSLSKLSKTLESAYYEIDDISHEMASYQDKITFDPKRLEEVEERLETIRELKRKYGNGIGDILKARDKMEAELDGLQGSDERIEGLRREMGDVRSELGKKCSELSELRKELAKDVEVKVKEELSELNMPKVKFKVKVEVCEDPDGVPVGKKTLRIGPKGIDEVEFQISPNPGEPLKPLAKIASGGEISRVMLALKSILGKADSIPTMIFDEIDIGIGGKTAVAVGEKLSGISKDRQVICITHLPQIASRRARHMHVSKAVQGGKTHVSLKELKGDDRISEVANLLGGKANESTLGAARELIGRA
jgi:DNA repair protein RecN (Recombination protein N)